jgi:hypothetical protein
MTAATLFLHWILQFLNSVVWHQKKPVIRPQHSEQKACSVWYTAREFAAGRSTVNNRRNAQSNAERFRVVFHHEIRPMWPVDKAK